MSRLKRKNFLNLLNNDYTIIEPFYIKEGPCIKQFGFLNSLCTQVTQAIINYTFIREYWHRFFPSKEFSCPCKSYPIKTRHHILYNCRRFNKYWNLKRDIIGQFVSFLEFNLSAFSFSKSITWVCNISALLN